MEWFHSRGTGRFRSYVRYEQKVEWNGSVHVFGSEARNEEWNNKNTKFQQHFVYIFKENNILFKNNVSPNYYKDVEVADNSNLSVPILLQIN